MMAQQMPDNTMKIATLLVSLGPEHSARILAQLDQAQVERIVGEIARMGTVSNQTKRAVIREFRTLVNAEEQRCARRSFAEEVLDTALGAEQARPVPHGVTSAAGTAYLRTITPDRAAELLSSEPAHIIGMLLSSLAPEMVAAILERLPADRQSAVALHLATAAAPAQEVREQLEQALRAKALRQMREEQANGRAVLKSMLASAPIMENPPAREPVAHAPATPPAIPVDDDTPSFFALTALAPSRLQGVMRAANLADLCLAFRGADAVLREACLRAMPFSRRLAVRAALRLQQPVRLREITAAQARVTALAQCAGEEISARARVGELLHV